MKKKKITQVFERAHKLTNIIFLLTDIKLFLKKYNTD